VTEDPDILLSQLGLRITKRRQEIGISQKALAEKIGMPSPGLSNIENGKQNVTIRTLCKIAEALDITVGELVSGVPPKRGAVRTPR